MANNGINKRVRSEEDDGGQDAKGPKVECSIAEIIVNTIAEIAPKVELARRRQQQEAPVEKAVSSTRMPEETLEEFLSSPRISPEAVQLLVEKGWQPEDLVLLLEEARSDGSNVPPKSLVVLERMFATLFEDVPGLKLAFGDQLQLFERVRRRVADKDQEALANMVNQTTLDPEQLTPLAKAGWTPALLERLWLSKKTAVLSEFEATGFTPPWGLWAETNKRTAAFLRENVFGLNVTFGFRVNLLGSVERRIKEKAQYQPNQQALARVRERIRRHGAKAE
tara:strand:- start:1736 stop:2575 length:840 start_codon:yes stop_codon:yes gene_type:complete